MNRLAYLVMANSRKPGRYSADVHSIKARPVTTFLAFDQAVEEFWPMAKMKTTTAR